MGAVNNVVDLAQYRRYKVVSRGIWKPPACPVCQSEATDDVTGWIYSYALEQFVCSEYCQRSASEKEGQE